MLFYTTIRNLLAGALVAIAATTVASAQALEPVIPYQGVLTGSDGRPLTGDHTIEVQLFAQPTGGTPIGGPWSKSEDLKGGLFSMLLGTPTGPAFPKGNSLANAASLWLSIRVDGNTFPNRVQLGGAAYAAFAFSVADNAVTTATISNSSIKAEDIEVKSITADRLAASGATAGQALIYDNVDGWKPGSVGVGGELTANSVTSTHIVDATIDAVDIKDNAVTRSKILDREVTYSKLETTSADNGEILTFDNGAWKPMSGGSGLTANSVGTTHIINGSVTTEKLAADAAVLRLNGLSGNVTLAEGSGVDLATAGNTITINGVLANNSVTTDKIENGAVTDADLATNSVTTAKIVNGNVTFEKLASGTADGQVLTYHTSPSRWVAETPASQGPVVPVGTIVAYFGEVNASNPVPTGWLLCDGAAVPPGSVYNPLKLVIGSSNTPDLRGMFLRGASIGRTGTFSDPDTSTRTAPPSGAGNATGQKIGSVQTDALESHIHVVSAQTNVPGGTNNNTNKLVGGPFADPNYGIQTTTPPTTGSISTETRPNNVYINWIIKAQ
jgi:hypothetical protein